LIERQQQRSPDNVTDDDLFAQLREGAKADERRQAGEVLVRRYRSKVFGWCLRFLGNEESAADITQEVFLALLENPRRYAARNRFGAWLYVVTRNRCYNAIRDGKGDRLTELDETLAETLRAASDPVAEAERGEIAQQVQQACACELAPREQAIVHLRYHWGLKMREITSLLRLENASGARTYLRTAEKKLRRALGSLYREMHPGTNPPARRNGE
jgi:RNA polymerase sigma-70 factor (ECF subfamily)